MKIPEAISLLEKSTESTSSKSELKDKSKLINVFKELETKDFTAKQNLLLEEQLTLLFEGKDLNYKNVKEGKKAFYSFLERKLFLVYEGYWKVVGTLTGSALGCTGLTLAMSSLEPYSNYFIAPLISMAIGFVIGAIMDASVEKQGRTIRTWP